jgi:hypothetical protein
MSFDFRVRSKLEIRIGKKDQSVSMFFLSLLVFLLFGPQVEA